MTQMDRMIGMTMATAVSVPSGGLLVPAMNNKIFQSQIQAFFLPQVRHCTPKCKPKNIILLAHCNSYS